MIQTDLSKAKKYVKLYYAAFGYQIGDFVPCEISGMRSDEIHHLDCKGMGGTKGKDRIENLMAVTRQMHDRYGDKTGQMAYLYKTHKSFMESNGVKFDETWIDQQIKKYS